MRPDTATTRLFALITLLIILELGRAVPVNAYAAIVYEHGLAKHVDWGHRGHVIPENQSTTFTQDDPFVYAYATVALYTANLTWQWYDPTEQLYRSRVAPVECAVSPCTFIDSILMATSYAATKFGVWRIDLLVDGFRLYSDYFRLTPVINQENHWDFYVLQSAPLRLHGNLTVTIHPDNQSWSFYSIYIVTAANVTAFESGSNRPLQVSQDNASLVVVDLGGPRSDGYTFVLSFDLIHGVSTLGGWNGGSFMLMWQEDGWMRIRNVHPIPETYKITLPQNANIADIVGINTILLNQNLTSTDSPVISIGTTVPPQRRFGWAIIYRDYTWRNSHLSTLPPTDTGPGLAYASAQPVPVLSLTLGGVSLWSAVMSAFLLTASELLTSIYTRAGILIDRRRLRIAGLLLVAVFLIATAYQLMVARYTLVIPVH